VDIPATNVNDPKGGRQCSSGRYDARQIGNEAEWARLAGKAIGKESLSHGDDDRERRPRSAFIEDMEETFWGKLLK
jgi:hypothetical protein